VHIPVSRIFLIEVTRCRVCARVYCVTRGRSIVALRVAAAFQHRSAGCGGHTAHRHRGRHTAATSRSGRTTSGPRFRGPASPRGQPTAGRSFQASTGILRARRAGGHPPRLARTALMPQNPPECRRIGHCVNTLADTANVTGPALGAPSGEVGGLPAGQARNPRNVLVSDGLAWGRVMEVEGQRDRRRPGKDAGTTAKQCDRATGRADGQGGRMAAARCPGG
jgi:hypothetical protein